MASWLVSQTVQSTGAGNELSPRRGETPCQVLKNCFGPLAIRIELLKGVDRRAMKLVKGLENKT